MSSEQLSEPTEESKILPWHRAVPKCHIYRGREGVKKKKKVRKTGIFSAIQVTCSLGSEGVKR